MAQGPEIDAKVVRFAGNNELDLLGPLRAANIPHELLGEHVVGFAIEMLWLPQQPFQLLKPSGIDWRLCLLLGLGLGLALAGL